MYSRQLYHNRARAKIGDFGAAGYLNKNSVAKTFQGGTLGYFAPELVDGDGYNESVDVYSYVNKVNTQLFYVI